jgi:hypothetical protein
LVNLKCPKSCFDLSWHHRHIFIIGLSRVYFSFYNYSDPAYF